MKRLAAAFVPAAIVCAVAAIVAPAAIGVSHGSDPHFADADDAALVTAGKPVYLRHCAGCHGRHLQGQALWQVHDQYAGRRAPAHDSSGHTWQHSDEDLFAMVKEGRFESEGLAGASSMPAFGGALSDRDILAATAFIKAGWPVGLRVAQAVLNPGLAGMPRQAAAADWRLPPNCNRALLRAPATSR